MYSTHIKVNYTYTFCKEPGKFSSEQKYKILTFLRISCDNDVCRQRTSRLNNLNTGYKSHTSITFYLKTRKTIHEFTVTELTIKSKLIIVVYSLV